MLIILFTSGPITSNSLQKLKLQLSIVYRAVMELQQEKDYFCLFSTDFCPFSTVFRPPRLIIVKKFRSVIIRNVYNFCTIYSMPAAQKEIKNDLKKRRKNETVKYSVLFDHIFSDQNYLKVSKFRRYESCPSFLILFCSSFRFLQSND